MILVSDESDNTIRAVNNMIIELMEISIPEISAGCVVTCYF